MLLFSHEQLSPWQASAKWSCCGAIWMTIAVYQHTVPVWYVEVAEFAGHHHDSSEPKQCWKPVPEEREPLLAEAEVLFMQRWFIENGLQMVWQQWCTEEGLEGRKRRKSWKLRMEMRGSSVTASTIQAMSSSCFALHHCNPFFSWACFLSFIKCVMWSKVWLRMVSDHGDWALLSSRMLAAAHHWESSDPLGLQWFSWWCSSTGHQCRAQSWAPAVYFQVLGCLWGA